MLVEKLKTLDFTKRWRVTVTDAKLNTSDLVGVDISKLKKVKKGKR